MKPMATHRAHLTVLWLRRLLLVVLLLLLAVLGLYLFGRPSGPGTPQPEAPDDSRVSPGEGVTIVGEGFDYTHYKEGRASFTIHAEKTLEDREETVFLEGVVLALHQEDGSTYDLKADRAQYHRDREEALLEGDVRFTDQKGFELTTDALELIQEGRLLNSIGPVEILYRSRYRATGERLRVHLPDDFFLLSGDVEVDSLPAAQSPLSLTAERLRLERSRQLLRADGGVVLRHGSDLLEARSINAFLDEDLSRLRFFRARWEVVGRRVLAGSEVAVGPPPPTVIEVTGRSLSLLMQTEDGEPENAQLEGTPAEPAHLRVNRPDGSSQVLTAGYLTGRFQGGEIEEVEAFGEPEVVELAAGTADAQRPAVPVRRLEGGRALLRAKTAGTLSSVRFTDGVEYRDANVEMTAEWATYDLDSGQGQFFGTTAPAPEGGVPPTATDAGRAPAKTVRLISPRGELEAPRVDYDHSSEVLHAHGGRVLTFFGEDGGLWPAPGLAGGEEAVRAEADEAFWRRAPQGVLLRGEVRLWRGENLLLAGWVRGDEEEGKLTAGDGVRTVAVPQPKPGEAPLAPLTVAAEEMLYLEAAGEVTYQGSVRAEQEGKKLSCERMEARLGEEDRAERLTCTGAVHFEDPVAGNQVDAERAIYQADIGQAEFFGRPAVVRDAQGRVVEAPHLTYELEAGRVTAGSDGSAQDVEDEAGAGVAAPPPGPAGGRR